MKIHHLRTTLFSGAKGPDWLLWVMVVALMSLFTAPCGAAAAEFYLRAAATTMVMPTGEQVTVWGFAKDSSFGAKDGVVTVPGPVLELPPGDTTLVIHLDNDLPEPVSIMVKGLVGSMTPVRLPDGRIRALNKEAQPGNSEPVTYTWTNVHPGTMMYQSASHLSVQVQMGLYGAVVAKADTGRAYDTDPSRYDSEVLLVLGEIDPDLHQAVASGNFGPGKAVTSAIGYRPKYFFINGRSYTPGVYEPAGHPGQRVLVRIVNGCLTQRSLVFGGRYVLEIGDGGFPLPFPPQHFAVFIAAGGTKDVIIESAPAGDLPVWDERLGLTNGGLTDGGIFTYLRFQ